jgi:hypothetical protein
VQIAKLGQTETLRTKKGKAMTTHDLVCPFLTEDPMFAAGVEFGMLFARLRNDEEPLTDIFLRENQDRILLLANRLGWTVEAIKKVDRFWFSCVLGKKKPALA